MLQFPYFYPILSPVLHSTTHYFVFFALISGVRLNHVIVFGLCYHHAIKCQQIVVVKFDQLIISSPSPIICNLCSFFIVIYMKKKLQNNEKAQKYKQRQICYHFLFTLLLKYLPPPTQLFILYFLFFTMSLFDDLVDSLPGTNHTFPPQLQSQTPQPTPFLHHLFDQMLDQQNNIACPWFWKDEDHDEVQVLQVEDNPIDSMKSARTEQEEKVRSFISKIQPINTMVRKVSVSQKTDVGSPKKKKIKKIA